MSSDSWDKTSMIGRLLFNNELENLDKQLWLDRFSSTVERNALPEEIRTPIRRSQSQLWSQLRVIVPQNGHCDAAVKNRRHGFPHTAERK